MKKLLIGICLLVGCGDAGVGPSHEGLDEGAGGAGGAGNFPDVDECIEDADCGEGFVCHPYQRHCYEPTEPVPCETDEVRLDVDLLDFTDANGTSLPRSTGPLTIGVGDYILESTGPRVPRPYPSALDDYILVENGDPLIVTIGATIIHNFELGEFEVSPSTQAAWGSGEVFVDIGGVECTFTFDDLIEGDGHVMCEHDGYYQLHVGYVLDDVCGYW